MIKKIKSFLYKKIKQKAVSKISKYLLIDGWLTPEEAFGLFSIANLLPINACVLEIGSWKGKSTWCISQGLKSGTINCIDPFNAAGEEGSKETYEKSKGNRSLLEQFNTNLSDVPKSVLIETFKGYSNEFVGRVKKIDFLFIDGDHSVDGCKFDFENFEKDLSVNGYIAFHDYYKGRNDLGPTWVIDNLLINNPSYEFFNNYDSLFVFKKIK
jgi:MMP 1-O-methyltransferase